VALIEKWKQPFINFDYSFVLQCAGFQFSKPIISFDNSQIVLTFKILKDMQLNVEGFCNNKRHLSAEVDPRNIYRSRKIKKEIIHQMIRFKNNSHIDIIA